MQKLIKMKSLFFKKILLFLVLNASFTAVFAQIRPLDNLSDGFTCEKTVIKLVLRTKNNNIFFKNRGFIFVNFYIDYIQKQYSSTLVFFVLLLDLQRHKKILFL